LIHLIELKINAFLFAWKALILFSAAEWLI